MLNHMLKKQVIPEIFDIHTMQATPGMRVGMKKLADGTAKVIIELHLKEPPKTVGEVINCFRKRLLVGKDDKGYKESTGVIE